MVWSRGDLNGNGPFYVGIDVWYSGVQTWANNDSRFDWSVKIGCDASNWPTWSGNAQRWYSSIGGVNYSGTFTLDFRGGSSQRNYEVGSGQTWHGHDANGFRPGFPSDAYIDTDHTSVGDGGSGQAWVDAPRIPKPPQQPHSLSIVNRTANSFGVNYGRGDNMGAGIDQDHAVWRRVSDGVDVWNDFGPNGYTNPRGNGDGPGPELSPHTQYAVYIRSHNSQGWSGFAGPIYGTTLGHPTEPRSVVGTPSTSVTGRIQVSWTEPATTGEGGIIGYNIYRNGVQVATTTGSGTGYTDNGLTPHTSYTYTVAARNSYSASVNSLGPQSSATTATAPGPPSAPRNLVAVAHSTIPGRVDLSWTAPLNTGGGITGYQIYFAGGARIANQNGTATTYSVTNLNPGTTYSFQVFARNSLGDIEGTKSPGSNTPTVSPVGEPRAPASLTVDAPIAFANRLTYSWTAPPGSLTGYNIFRRQGTTDTLIGSVPASFTSFSIDNLPAGSPYTVVVRARTAYTDTLGNGYPGNWGGPASSAVTGTPSSNQSQFVPYASAVISGTNAVFSGTYTVNAVTATTIGYARIAANIPLAASAGSVYNNTNAAYNGTYTISVPTLTSLTYAKTNANIGLLNAAGLLTNNTNIGFNGTFSVTAVNSGANTVSYANTGSNLAATSVPPNETSGQSGKITNLSNTIFNGVGKVITAVTATTLKYAQTNSDVAESNAAGTVTNTTNRDIFNGIWVVASIPAHNIVRYARNAANVPLRTWNLPNGILTRNVSPATLDVRFRSGWSG